MFDHHHYVPILKWKQGEYLALRELAATDKDAVTPLVELIPVPAEEDDDVAPAAVDMHIARVPTQVASNWGTAHRLFVDLGLVQDSARTSLGRHPLDQLFEGFSAEGVLGVPVTGPERDAGYQTAVRQVVARDGNGVCVRLTTLEAFDGDPATQLDELLEALAIQRSDVDLLVDFGAVEPTQATLVRAGALGLLATLPNIADYRSLTFASGAFPLNLSQIPGGTVGLLPRTDWAIWRSLSGARLPRLPTFGDYTAAHPVLPLINPVVMQMSASIRYCHDGNWLIYRGFSVRSPNHGGYAQFNQLSQLLAADPRYSGPTFSWADQYIADCANGGPTGNPAKWRQVATNRHLVCALRQIASLP